MILKRNILFYTQVNKKIYLISLNFFPLSIGLERKPNGHKRS